MTWKSQLIMFLTPRHMLALPNICLVVMSASLSMDVLSALLICLLEHAQNKRKNRIITHLFHWLQKKILELNTYHTGCMISKGMLMWSQLEPTNMGASDYN